MKILVVDDDLNKMLQLTAFLKAECPDAEILERKSYQSGLSAALFEKPDLVVLDMSMPTFDIEGKEKGGKDRRYAGQLILRRLRRRRVMTGVVIVTQFERFGEGAEMMTLAQLEKGLEGQGDPNYLGTIFYNAADSSWMFRLREVIEQLKHRSAGAQP